jgi:3-phenylpropionate/trans-cinnamate dioxygenase ferredoxin component
MTTEYIRVCAENEVTEGQIKTFEIKDRPIAVARWQGSFFALDNICTHDGGSLGEGDLVKGQIQCPRHGARFDLKTGQVTRMPAVIGIGTYEIKIEDGDVFVAIPE